MTHTAALDITRHGSRSRQDDDRVASSFTLGTFVRLVGMLVAVTMLYTALANWGWNNGVVPAPPLVFIAFVVGCAGLSSLLDGCRGISVPLLCWASASAVLAMAAFLWSSGSDVALQETQTRILGAALLASLGALLSDGTVRHITRWSVVFATLFSVAVNLWEVTHPMTFSAVLGRSAGLYVNPNIAGAAIIAGMLIGLPVVPGRTRELYTLVAGLGVLTTLSRGAMLVYLLCIVLLSVSRAVRGTRVLAFATVGGIAGISLAATLLASGQLGYLAGGAEQFVRKRLMISSSEGFNADVSASSRSRLAMTALEMFGERPLQGHGTGATVEWREPESTHNIYARQLAEYGVLGAWLAPALLLVAWRAARRLPGEPSSNNGDIAARAAPVFVAFVAVWGLFSHNVLEDTFILLGLALMVTQGRPRA